MNREDIAKEIENISEHSVVGSLDIADWHIAEIKKAKVDALRYIILICDDYIKVGRKLDANAEYIKEQCQEIIKENESEY